MAMTIRGKRKATPLLLSFAGILLLVICIRQAGAVGNTSSAISDEDRFGVCVSGEVSNYDLSLLHIRWYQDWRFRTAPPRPGGVTYYQLVRARPFPPNWASLQLAVQENPGSVWMIGNEPDCIHQDNLLPGEYAQVYHDIYVFIKGIDPTAQISAVGIVQPTPLRLRWLDMVLDAYQSRYGTPMPVDAWNIHNQILQEKRGDWGCDIPPGISVDEGRLYSVTDNASATVFAQHVRDFRAWMVARGHRDKPLVISEYGVLMPSSYFPNGDQAIIDFMTSTLDWMLQTTDGSVGFLADSNRLVQRWAWFSLDHPWNGQLMVPGSPFPGTLTVFGQAYKSYVEALTAPTPTPTPTPQPPMVLHGQVDLQRHQPLGDASWATYLQVSFVDAQTGQLVRKIGVDTDRAGVFTVTTDLPPGLYGVSVKGLHTLENVWPSIALESGWNSANWGELLEGDANDDNRIDILDYSILFGSFWTGNPHTDFNQDGNVDTLDYSLLWTNFWETGPRQLDGSTIVRVAPLGDSAHPTEVRH